MACSWQADGIDPDGMQVASGWHRSRRFNMDFDGTQYMPAITHYRIMVQTNRCKTVLHYFTMLMAQKEGK